jgi:hypothetical protein
VSIFTTVAVISVRHAKRPKGYLNTEDVIKELKILSCIAEEIIENREQRLKHRAYNSIHKICSLIRKLLLCACVMIGLVKTYKLIYS